MAAEERVIDKEALWEKVGYHPHAKQLLFHNSPARFRIPVCGRRFGKSKMAAEDAVPELFRPNTRGWIVGPTYVLGEKEFRYIWDDIVLTLGLGDKIRKKAYNVRTGEMYIEMPWGSRVDVKSADHPDSLVGEGLDWLIVSEAAKQKEVVWEKYLRPALADKLGWATFPSTPEGQNWYYELYLRGQKGRMQYSPQYESWNFPSWENPHVYPGGWNDAEIQDQLRTPDDPWFWQEIGADFRSFVGKIYPEWSDEVHIMKEHHEYHPDWPNYLMFDFGFSAPFVALDVQIDPQDNVYIWREYYVREVPLHKNALELLHRSNPEGYSISCGFGDAADPGAVEVLSETLCPVFASNDAKDVQRGIQEIRRFLLDKYGKPHLFVDPYCTNTIWEFQNYRSKQLTKPDVNPPEDPRKWADHSMDALRYGIMNLYVLGARHHLTDVYTPNESYRPVGAFSEEGGGSDSFFTTDDEAPFHLVDENVW